MKMKECIGGLIRLESISESLDIVDKILDQEIKRYKDLAEYFGNNDNAKIVLGDKEEHKKQIESIKLNVSELKKKVRTLEAGKEAILSEELGEIRSEIEFEVDHRTGMLCAEDVFRIIDKHIGKSKDRLTFLNELEKEEEEERE